MARVLALSSHVAYGSVGLAAIVPALQRLGHEVMALPTVVLSNHLGYASFAGEEISPAILDRIIDALAANGWLSDVGAVLTGYLPTEAHVASARAAIARTRKANPAALIVCDPVLGDDPAGIYLDEAAAAAIRRHLLPMSDVATPNRFELEWLAGAPVHTLDTAASAARKLGVATVLATSIPATGPASEDRLATLLIDGQEARVCFVPRREAAPHGTGDLLAALYLGHVLNGAGPTEAMARAVAAVEASIVASLGRDELALTAAAPGWASAQPLPTTAV